jgi:hypothetical protein
MGPQVIRSVLLLSALVLGTSVVGLFGQAQSEPKTHTENTRGCLVTGPSDHPFVPPKPYWAGHGDGEFYYGNPALWTIVYPGWHIHSGGKLPFWRVGYDWKNEEDPRLTVVARRLDHEAPLVWNGWANNAWDKFGSFMTTGVDLPSSGCWEIAAHYVASPDNIQTLTYTVWVAP